MICHDCRNGYHEACKDCPCQHKATDDKGVPLDAGVVRPRLKPQPVTSEGISKAAL